MSVYLPQIDDELTVQHSGHHHANHTVKEVRSLGWRESWCIFLGMRSTVGRSSLRSRCSQNGPDIGVILAAVIMWKVDSPYRFYADPAVSLVIGFIIFGGAVPLSELTDWACYEVTHLTSRAQHCEAPESYWKLRQRVLTSEKWQTT